MFAEIIDRLKQEYPNKSIGIKTREYRYSCKGALINIRGLGKITMLLDNDEIPFEIGFHDFRYFNCWRKVSDIVFEICPHLWTKL